MARVTLTPTVIARSGTYPAFTTAATGGFSFANTGKEFLMIDMGPTGTTLHLDISHTVDSQSVVSKTIHCTGNQMLVSWAIPHRLVWRNGKLYYDLSDWGTYCRSESTKGRVERGSMAAKKKGKWIQKAKLKKGAFTKKAKAAGKSVGAMASKVLKKGSKASAKTKRQAALAKTFRKMAKKRKRK